MTVGLTAVFVGLFLATFGADLLQRYAPDVVGNTFVAHGVSVGVAAATLMAFLQSAYYRLTNARLSHREVVPGALLAALTLAVTLQGLPLFVEVSSGIVALQALGATFLLLVWLYVMANVIVFGSVFNWQLAHGRTGRPVEPRHPASTGDGAPGAPAEAATGPEAPGG